MSALVQVVVIGLVCLLVGAGLEVHRRSRVRARGDTLDVWCAGQGWRRETDHAVARTVGARVAAPLLPHGRPEHLVAGATADGREAVAVGWTHQTHSGGIGEDSSSTTTTHHDVVVALRLAGTHPELRIGPHPAFVLFDRDRARVCRTGHPDVDHRLRIVADDGAHAAAVAPHDVLVHLAADPSRTSWCLRGDWLFGRRRGVLEPAGLEALLAQAQWLADRADRVLTVPAGSPAPGPRTR
ncbi:hypothetical protein WCD74_02330 [Actinomycetospora sp. OC33-EN08]|uniref:Secreted protein n=1 Tax=Actinomycetospora aurantiaca TaxID=3129233 RepID=A0ABU8MGZ0_9PSEU